MKYLKYLFLLSFSIFASILIFNFSYDKKDSNESLVYIKAFNEEYISEGSGFVYKTINNKNYIITNYHVVKGCYGIDVYNKSKKHVKAKLVGFDELNDIAVLTINNELNLKNIYIGNSDNININDNIIVKSLPFYDEQASSYIKGIIININQPVSLEDSIVGVTINAIQINTGVNYGNSGSPVLNDKGQVIGVIFVRHKELKDIAYALPINDVMKVVNNIENTNSSAPSLGAVMTNTTNEEMLTKYQIDTHGIVGVVVIQINNGGALYNIGVTKGDIIVKLNNVQINNVDDLKNELYKYKKGQNINITYYHEGYIVNSIIELK